MLKVTVWVAQQNCDPNPNASGSQTPATASTIKEKQIMPFPYLYY